MRRTISAGLILSLTLLAAGAPAGASLVASSTISRQQLGPGSYEYTLTLKDVGDTPIGTFWFGWFPSYDLLPSHPTSISSPAGWTGADAPDDFGVASARWVNTANPLQPGQTLGGFKFDTPDANITTGTSFFNVPIDQSYVYVGAPEIGSTFAFTPSEVTTPEPASIALLGLGALGLLARRRRTP